jgi:hypothetical protein
MVGKMELDFGQTYIINVRLIRMGCCYGYAGLEKC